MKLRGTVLLKVASIIMIVGAILGAIVLFGTIALIANYNANVPTVFYLTLAVPVLELITGIIGVKNCYNREAAGKCLVWGVILLVASILSIIVTAVTLSSMGASSSSILSDIVTGPVLPILYIVGANLNKNS